MPNSFLRGLIMSLNAFRIVHFATLRVSILACVACLFPLTANVRPAVASPARDTICGPRCVRFLLEYFDADDQPNSQLLDLVREMQWPNIGNGCSLDDIRVALERRSIAVSLQKVDCSQPLRMQSPAVVHLRADTEPIGHFAVWLPSSSATSVDLWTFPNGLTRLTGEEFAKVRHELILATPAPNKDASSRKGHLANPLVIAGVAFAGVSLACLRPRSRTPTAP